MPGRPGFKPVPVCCSCNQAIPYGMWGPETRAKDADGNIYHRRCWDAIHAARVAETAAKLPKAQISDLY